MEVQLLRPIFHLSQKQFDILNDRLLPIFVVALGGLFGGDGQTGMSLLRTDGYRCCLFLASTANYHPPSCFRSIGCRCLSLL